MLTLNIVKGDVDQSWSVSRIVKERIPATWDKVFEEAKYDLEETSEYLEKDERENGMWYPLKKNLFDAFHYTPLNMVKVVIIGQDPYPQTVRDKNGNSIPRAQGLSFSVSPDDEIPSSLKNIFKELQNSYRGFIMPEHGDLRQWAKQGVLLLNACLTLVPGKPASHGAIWSGFVSKVCRAISEMNPKCIYMMWGQNAQKLRTVVGEKSVILEAAHPSGQSAHRGFFGCNHFNQANEILLKQGHSAINWNIRKRDELTMPINNKLLLIGKKKEKEKKEEENL